MSVESLKFRDFTPEKRLALVGDSHNLDNTDLTSIKNGGLDINKADSITENVIGIYSLPLGIAKNFLINGKEYDIPMVTEEPSIIAGASKAAKILKESGGIIADANDPVGVGQIELFPKSVEASSTLISTLENHKTEIIEKGNSLIPHLYKLGGGIRDFEIKKISSSENKDRFAIYIKIDTQDAMGANIIDTVCERLSPIITQLSNSNLGIRIVSNFSTDRLVWAKVSVPLKFLNLQETSGETVAGKIVDAQDFAANDIYRAVTHNKGIFNGIDALLLATGNDWRANEASGHAFACRNGSYQPLTNWNVESQKLIGEISLPIQVGTVGGLTKIHPVIQANLKILGVNSSRELSCIVASVGLVQNFAALHALVTDGIQKGHMKLHKRKFD